MADRGTRRSTRTRKAVKTYAEEQAKQEQASVRAPRAGRKKRPLPEISGDEGTDEAELRIVVDDESDPEIGEKSDTPSPPPVKKRAKNAKKNDGKQLYGAPPEGTMIPWLEGRQRRQPKVYPVPKRSIAKKSAWLEDAATTHISRQMAAIPMLAPGEQEKRLRSYVNGTPDWYEAYLERASTQKMFVLERTRGIEEDCHAGHEDCPYETLRIAGSKGNIYNIHISHLATCTCPVGLFSKKGDEKQCKHVLYALHHVLKAPDHLKMQPAFLSSELKELFGNAAPLPMDIADESIKDGNRKEVDGDCPICFMEFEDDEDVVWCKAACGNNVHKSCFDRWAKTKATVTCPFCRSAWDSGGTNKLQKATMAQVRDTDQRGAGGYVNVFNQLDYE